MKSSLYLILFGPIGPSILTCIDVFATGWVHQIQTIKVFCHSFIPQLDPHLVGLWDLILQGQREMHRRKQSLKLQPLIHI